MAGPFDNQNVDTMTPGSAVADTLQNILASRRATARQQMLDQIQAANMASEMGYRKEQAESNRLYRESWAQQRQALAQEEQAKADEIKRKQGALSGIQIDPSWDPKVQMLIKTAQSAGDYDMLKQLGPLLDKEMTAKQGGKVYFADEASKRLTDAAGQPFTGQLGAYDKVVNVPVKEFAPKQGVPIYGTDSVTNQPSVIMADPTQYGQVKLPPTFRVLGRFGTEAQNNPPDRTKKGKISDNTYNQYVAATQALSKNGASPETLQGTNQFANRIIQEYQPSNPSISDALRLAWGAGGLTRVDPKSGKLLPPFTSDEVIARMHKATGVPQFPPQDEADIRNIWSTLTGQ